MYRDVHLQSIEQRCKFNLLKLLHYYSKEPNHVKKSNVLTRAATKVTFKIPTRCCDKYLNSPLYKGTRLWNNLDHAVQRLDSIDQFIKHVKQPYLVYRNCFINRCDYNI